MLKVITLHIQLFSLYQSWALDITFCDNATMTKDQKIAACRVVVSFFNMVAVSMSRKKVTNSVI